MVLPQKLRELIDESFALDKSQLESIMKKFDEQIEQGLKKSTHASSEIKCFITYVQNLPKGDEHGDFLALDLGGTNFRVLLIHLRGNEERDICINKENNYVFESQIYEFPPKLMTGCGDDLFDYIAKCLAEFTKIHGVQNKTLPLGFTFSFPCEQVGLTEGKLIKWTKGFSASDVVSF
jgi:hexokinase